MVIHLLTDIGTEANPITRVMRIVSTPLATTDGTMPDVPADSDHAVVTEPIKARSDSSTIATEFSQRHPEVLFKYTETDGGAMCVTITPIAAPEPAKCYADRWVVIRAVVSGEDNVSTLPGGVDMDDSIWTISNAEETRPDGPIADTC
jgi:hypothetical protein